MGARLAVVTMRPVLLALAALAGSILAACGDDAGEDPAENGAVSAPGQTATITGAGDDGVPDACSLLTAEQLSAALGTDVGTGAPQSAAPERSICIFASSGLILAVEVAENYARSRELIDEDGRITEDVPGVGNAAFFDPAGQLIVLGNRYFVGVTGGGDLDALKQIATQMLAAAGDG